LIAPARVDFVEPTTHAAALQVVRVQTLFDDVPLISSDKPRDKIVTGFENSRRREATPLLRVQTLGTSAQENRAERTAETHLRTASDAVNGAETPAVGHDIQSVGLRPDNGFFNLPVESSQLRRSVRTHPFGSRDWVSIARHKGS
jgi:hypothetical protein